MLFACCPRPKIICATGIVTNIVKDLFMVPARKNYSLLSQLALIKIKLILFGVHLNKMDTGSAMTVQIIRPSVSAARRRELF